MTVPVQPTFTASIANGVTTVFPYGFKIAAAEDLAVTVDGARLTSGYTVSGVGNPAGGDVTITVPPANGAKVLRYLAPIFKRDTDYQQFGDWLAAVVNLDFDRIWLTLQTLQQNDVRSLKLPVDTSVDQVLTQDAAARANRTIKFDGAGNLTISTYDPDGAQASAAASATASAASATAASGSATSAAGSATAASGSATAASTAATNSANSASAAANSATQAANNAALVGFTLTDLQTQGKTAATSAGAAPAFTVATNPAYGALAAGQRMRVKFHAAGTTGSNTLNRDGLGAKNLMQYDATGTKVAAVVASGQLADVEYDGVDMVILDPLPPAAASGVPVRQTVLGGPTDTSGFPSFLPATAGSLSITSQNVTSTAPFVVAAANGFGASGAVDRIGQSTSNLTWSSLTANSTNFLFVDVAANGVLTPGSTTLAPAYQFGGTRSTTSGWATFNIQEMSMTVGNGSSAVQTWRVFVGEAVTNAGTVTSTVAYAYQGKYVSAEFGYAAGTAYNTAHNLGVVPRNYKLVAVCKTTDLGYSPGTELQGDAYYNASHGPIDRNTNRAVTYNGVTYQTIFSATTQSAMTLANWKLKYYIDRGW